MKDIRPLSFVASIPYFLIPCLLLFASIYLLMPWMDSHGFDLFTIFLAALGAPLALLLILALLISARQAGSSDGMAARLRLVSMNGRTWLYTIALCIVFFATPILLSFTSEWILARFPMPSILVRLYDARPGIFMGRTLKGDWLLFSGFLSFSLVNVLGEELWWRGVILPRQELSLGRWTWFVHGMLWAAFHSFFHWEVLSLLPGCIALSFVAQRTRNTWPGIIAHFAVQAPTILAVLVGVIRG